ncbi:MAG: tetratricopeptide repeat protein [Candidatus Cloacimonetes bacterium]|nr:tetratricopeptide repeat protein [Candidatus Cloacimonadota bacterium]
MKSIKKIKPLLLSGFLILFFLNCNLSASNSYYYFTLAEIAMNNGNYAKADSLLQQAQKLDPNSKEILKERLNALYYLGENKKIIKLCKKAIKKNPDNPELYLILVDSYQKLDNIKKAKKYLNKAEKYAGDDVDIMYRIAIQSAKLNEKEIFFSLLKKILEIQPDFVNANAWLGDYYFQQNDYKKAIEYLQHLLNYKESILTTHSTFFRELILSYYYTQNYKKIIELSKSLPLENLGPTVMRILFVSSFKTQNYNATVYYGNIILQKSEKLDQEFKDETNEILAIAEYKLQNYDKAFDCFSKIKNEKILLGNLKIISTISHLINNGDLLNHLMVSYSKGDNDTLFFILQTMTAQFYAEKDSLQYASNILEKIDTTKLPIKYGDDYILTLLSYTYLKTKDDVSTATELLNKRKDKTPHTHLWIGNFYKNEKQYEKAIYYHKEAIKEDSTNIATYFSLATIYNTQKELENEIIVLENAIQLFPDNAELLNWLGYTLVDNDTRLDYSLILLQKAISLDPDNVYIWDSLAWAYYKFGNYAEALKSMKLVLEKDVQDTVIRYHIGNIYWKLGQIESAKENWNLAIEIDNNEEAKLQSEEMLKKFAGENNEGKKED